MVELKENELLEHLKCPICLEFADDPIECNSCSNIFCKKCVGYENPSNIKVKLCPICRNAPSYKEAAFAKRLLASLPIDCPNSCGKSISRNDLKAHLLKCENRPFSCNLCDYTGKKKEFMEHINSNHENELIDRFNKVIEVKSSTPVEAMNPVKQNNTQSPEKVSNSVPQMINGKYYNSNNLPLTAGVSGLYYCGGKSDVECGCCDGNCGPDNGCLCTSCMKFNCRLRNLREGILLNEKGFPAVLLVFNGTSQFFCGAEYQKDSKNFLQKVFDHRKIKCEPPNEPCSSCKKLLRLRHFYIIPKKNTKSK